jgi:hypothetical protein
MEDPRDAALVNGHDDDLVRVEAALATLCEQRDESPVDRELCEGLPPRNRLVEEADTAGARGG